MDLEPFYIVMTISIPRFWKWNRFHTHSSIYARFLDYYLVTKSKYEIDFRYQKLAIEIVTTNINIFQIQDVCMKFPEENEYSLQTLELISTPSLGCIFHYSS